MADMENLNVEALDNVAGGAFRPTWVRAVVIGQTTYPPHYLALRNDAAYDDRNEFGKLYHGDEFEVRPDIISGDYSWARALGMQGWVNKNYIRY